MLVQGLLPATCTWVPLPTNALQDTGAVPTKKEMVVEG